VGRERVGDRGLIEGGIGVGVGEIFVTSPPTSASVGVSTDGAGWPFWTALASVFTWKLNGIVCVGEFGAAVVNEAIQSPAVGNVAWVT